MQKPVVVELYVRGLSASAAAQRLERATLKVSSIGVAHVYVEVLAESDQEAIDTVRRLSGAPGDDVHLVRSYLDAPAHVAQRGSTQA